MSNVVSSALCEVTLHSIDLSVVSRVGFTLNELLLRKEVIQPQVLLQLPCYDFTPIINHTVNSCLPEGLAHRFQVQPTFVM